MLKFATETEALQYLSDITGKRVKVASDKKLTVGYYPLAEIRFISSNSSKVKPITITEMKESRIGGDGIAIINNKNYYVKELEYKFVLTPPGANPSSRIDIYKDDIS